MCGGALFSQMGNRPNAVCKGCGSLERTRLMGLYLEKLFHKRENLRILHIAPEPQLVSFIDQTLKPGWYVLADIVPGRIENHEVVGMDVCDISGQESNMWDLIIHSHVLEHVLCNYTYVVYHLDRILDNGGLQLAVIPTMSGFYDENLGTISEEERVYRFGQKDHVRRFGESDLDMTLGKVLKLPKVDHLAYHSELELREANIPQEVWRGWGHSAVLVLRKGSFLLKD